MRSDFNKQLTERERIGSEWCFREVRNCKGNAVFDEDAKGGKESMHRRRRETFVSRKSFNENLNPLRNFLRVNVDRPWNKVFSELNKAFDRRKVVNDHIFQHLFDYVEINAKLIDGKVCVLNSERNYRRYDYKTGTYGEKPEDYYDKRWTPIKEDFCEWYVHPVDGLLKANNKISKKHRRENQAKARQAAADKVFKVVDADHHLYLEDGVWMVYGIMDRPAPVEQLFAPPGMMSYVFEAMTKAQKREVGVRRMVTQSVNEYTAPAVASFARGSPGRGRYYATRNTASKKLLKQFGLEGTAIFNEEAVVGMSHREFSKYKKAA